MSPPNMSLSNILERIVALSEVELDYDDTLNVLQEIGQLAKTALQKLDNQKKS